MIETLKADVLVVGGGTGGTAAAIQAARRGAKTILVSEFPWLGGMLTSAGVPAPDGNELVPLQTGLWGAFLRELRSRQPEDLNHAWVSFFTYEPRIGAEIFADWVAALPNLRWISGELPLEVLSQGDRITGVRFTNLTVQAQITLDATELGDLLALAEIPHRWGWEWQQEFNEPSAPIQPNELTNRYPVQSPTWVVMLQDFGEGQIAPEIPPPPNYNPAKFTKAWDGYGPEKFLNYGRLPGNRFMLNWPQAGNDYGVGLERLMGTPTEQQAFLQEAFWQSQGFAHFIQQELQQELGRRYGLAPDMFPESDRHTISETLSSEQIQAFALHPYFRESRRVIGTTTVIEPDILPVPGGQVAPLPVDAQGTVMAIAPGNYANDHHYPEMKLPLQPKSMRWGGRWTGTPFTLPYGCLVPQATDGLLVCEKNISVSHIANGATRLQPMVLGLGQSAGMAAALCVEQQCQPRDLPVRELQDALLMEAIAPLAIIPLLNLPPSHPHWLTWQRHYLEHPDQYPADGNVPDLAPATSVPLATPQTRQSFTGTFRRSGEQSYTLILDKTISLSARTLALTTLHPDVNQALQTFATGQHVAVEGQVNLSGQWFLVDRIHQA
jgi:hypothetical protein